MSRVTRTAACIALVVSLTAFAGCRKEPAPAPPAGNQPAPTDPAKQPAADAGQDSKIQAAFASLSTEDRAIATKQKICPVSGEGLGTMGAPIKVDVAGQQVFICCEGCKDPLLQNPAQHLAKIGLKPAGEAAPQ